MASDPAHQLRAALDAAVQRLIERLQTDPDWERRGLELREYLQNDETLGRYVQDLWTSLRERLQKDLADDDSGNLPQGGRHGAMAGHGAGG